MARRRAALRPEDARTEGERRLRVLLRRKTFGEIARAWLVDESAVRFYARGRRRPVYEIRARARKKDGIPESSWDEPPADDVYEATDPPTRKRA